MAPNPLIRRKQRSYSIPLPNQSAGILDDHSVRKASHTKENYVQKFSAALTTITSNYTLEEHDHTVLLNGTSNTVTLTLPTASRNKERIIYIKSIDTTNQTDVATNGSEEIDGDSANFILVKHEVITLHSDGSNWWII